MFCEHCGKEIDDNAKFCENCGAKTERTDKSPTVGKEKTENSVPAEREIKNSEKNTKKPKAKGRSKSKKDEEKPPNIILRIIFVLCAVIIFCVSVGSSVVALIGETAPAVVESVVPYKQDSDSRYDVQYTVNYRFKAKNGKTYYGSCIMDTGSGGLNTSGYKVSYLSFYPEVNRFVKTESLAASETIEDILENGFAAAGAMILGLFLTYFMLWLAFPKLPFFGNRKKKKKKSKKSRKKKYNEEGEFFCRNCGRKIEKGVKSCPECSMPYKGSLSEKKELLIPYEDAKDHRKRSVARYIMKYWLWGLLFGAIWCLLVFVAMLLIGDISLSDGDFSPMLIPIAAVFGVGIIFLIGMTFKIISHIKPAREINSKKDAEMSVCAACGYTSDKEANYCPRCGTAIKKYF